jgi:hypothetical protein
MAIKIQRKPFKIGSSIAVTLPRSWCDFYGHRVDKVTIFGGKLLIICPSGLEVEASELISDLENNKPTQKGMTEVE